MALEVILVPTYNCMSVYVVDENAPLGATTGDDDAALEYREVGGGSWLPALPLWFDTRAVNTGGNFYGGQEYRGSVFNLDSNTNYEFRYTVKGRSVSDTFSKRTWKDPDKGEIQGTVRQLNRSYTTQQTLNGVRAALILDTPGSENNWNIYVPHPDGTVIDSGGFDVNIMIRAPYTIVRGVTCKNALRHGILIGSKFDSVPEDIHSVIIEKCKISRWGEADGQYGRNNDSGIFSNSSKARRMTISRNHIFEPKFGANPWRVIGERGTTHPRGPKAITINMSKRRILQEGYASTDDPSTARILLGSNIAGIRAGACYGNNVIRYNSMWADSEAGSRSAIGKKFNDVMGGQNTNFSNTGFMCRDTDIYGNTMNDCWDDAIEGDGAYRNCRVYKNFFNNHFIAHSHQGIIGGPVYYIKNVYGSSRYSLADGGGAAVLDPTGGTIFKHSANDTNPNVDVLGGRIYFLNNTTLPFSGGVRRTAKACFTGGMNATANTDSKPVNVRSYNNVIFISPERNFGNVEGQCHFLGSLKTGIAFRNRVDYDHLSAQKPNATSSAVQGATNGSNVNANGWSNANESIDNYNVTYAAMAEPAYPTLSNTPQANVKLASSSRGYGDGLFLPNVTPSSNIDIGAQQRGEANLQYGPLAEMEDLPEEPEPEPPTDGDTARALICLQ